MSLTPLNFHHLVNQNNEERGFSTTMIMPLESAICMIRPKNSYKVFARDTLLRFVGERFNNPSGKDADLNGTGPGNGRPLLSQRIMFLAKEQVPHGGAKNTPRALGASNQVRSNCWPASVVKSATLHVEMAFPLI